MNIFKYADIYRSFHKCFTYRADYGLIVLDLADIAWEPWLVTRLYRADKISHRSTNSLVTALKIHFKTETPHTVFCKQDSWSVLLGRERIVLPMSDEHSATLHLYSTPYFVRDPDIVKELMQGNVLPAYDHFYPYKNCILYLDGQDVPKPGKCYFDHDDSVPHLYRLCILSTESIQHVAPIADEWKNRRHVLEIPFLSDSTVVIPKCIDFDPVPAPHFPDTSLVFHGNVYKRQSFTRPHCLLHDVLASYQHHQSKPLKNVGLVVEWPLELIFEGTRKPSHETKRVVALSINGSRPERVVSLQDPYEHFVEYSHVPDDVRWTPVSFVPVVLELPLDLVKVSVDAVVIGFVYLGSFFCFGEPVLEGRASWVHEYNVDSLLTPVCQSTIQSDRRIRVVETFRLDEKFSLHRVSFQDVPLGAWCLTKSRDSDAYAKQLKLPPLVQEWTHFFKRHYHPGDSIGPVQTDVVKLALVLARHMICFRVKIENRAKKEAVILSENEITLIMSESEVDFVNRVRLQHDRESSATCSVM